MLQDKGQYRLVQLKGMGLSVTTKRLSPSQFKQDLHGFVPDSKKEIFYWEQEGSVF